MPSPKENEQMEVNNPIPQHHTETPGDFSDFIAPRKTRKLATTGSAENKIPQKNRFSPLETEVPVQEPTKKQRPPPIVLHGDIQDHRGLRLRLAKEIQNGFHIKYNRYNTSVFLHDSEEYKKYKETLINAQTQFHTYTMKSEKTHAFVAEGLDEDVTPEEIEKELKLEHGFPVKTVYRMTTRKAPLFMVVTDNTVTIKNLIAEVRHISHIKVNWHRHINKREITQCHRCQAWGHSTSNCNLTPKCLKCAENHMTKNCEIEEEEPRKCINCGGGHVASSTECEVYQRILMSRNERKTQRGPIMERPKFVPAPPPTFNAWTARTRAAAAQATTQDATAQPAPTQRPTYAEQTVSLPKHDTHTNYTQSDLQNALIKLDTLIDIQFYTEQTLKLINILENCNSEIEKFNAFYKFTTTLNNKNRNGHAN